MLACSWVGDSSALTLEEALKTLVERHPQIRAAESGVVSSQAGIGVAQSRFYPTLNLSGDGGYEGVDAPGRRSNGQDTFDGERRKLTLSLTQNLFDGFARESNRDQAVVSRDAAKLNLNAVRQSVLVEGVNAFLGLIRESRLVTLATENERTIQQQLSLEDERVQRGAGIAVDVLLSKARLQIAKERRIAFEGARKDARSRFRQVFNFDAAPGTLVEPELPSQIVPASLDVAVAHALRDNPGLERASRLVQLADEKKRGAASGYWPKVDIVGRLNQEHDVDGVPGKRKDAAVLLQLTWDLFSGFSTDYAVRQAAADASQSRETEESVRRKTIEEVNFAWEALETARAREALLVNAVDIAGEVFEARKRLRDTGRETALNVLDAENEVYAARINLVVARHDAQAAIYRLLAAIGALEATSPSARR